ncbi:Ig-like domain-containing protein [Pseudomonas sp. IT-196MI5]|uniref:hypothetical protein n=1 Tax=Pseudomonas sp. IT-196MI5 TaxID=3026440 RepID=UPI0039E1104D
MTIEFKAGATGIDPVYICHGADHDFKIAAGADSPWVNHGVSFNQVPGESSPITTEPELGTYQKFLAAGTEWKLNCPANGTDIDFNLQLQSEFTAVPCKVALKLGDYRRAILSKRDPISAPVVGDKVTAEVQIGSFYTDKKLEGVEVEWCDDEGFVQSVPTTSLGWSKFEHTFTTAGEHTMTAKVHSPYDDTTAEEKFTINVYAESPWEQATLLINDNKVEWGAELVLLRGQENDVTVEVPPEIARELNLGLTEGGGLNIIASPDFGDWVAPVDGRFNWKITPGAGKSGRIALIFYSREVLVPWEHRSLVISSNLADEADVKIGGVEVPAGGNWFIRDKAQTVTLTPKSGSPLAGLPVTLSCTIKSGLDAANVVSAPAFDSEQTTYSWAVTGNTKSGTFQLALTAKGMTTPITLAISKLISSNLADEADVKIGGAAVPAGGNWFYRGKAQTVTLIPKSGSPLAGLPVTLSCTIKSGLDAANVVSAPAFDSEQTAYSWAVTGNTKSGTFQLALAGKGMTTPITLAISKLISNNLNDEATGLLDGIAIAPTGADFIGGQVRTLSLEYKNADLLFDLPLALDWIPDAGLVTGDLTAQPPFRQFSTQHEWELTGAYLKSGTFKLKVFSQGENTVLLTPTNRLHGGETFKFVYLIGADMPLPPEEVNCPPNILFSCGVMLLKSDGTPMVGVPITFTVPDYEPQIGETNPRGEVFRGLFIYSTPGVRKIVAVATLPTGNKSIEALVRISGGGS